MTIEGVGTERQSETCDVRNRNLGVTELLEDSIHFAKGWLHFLQHKDSGVVLILLCVDAKQVELSRGTWVWVPGNPDLLANATENDMKILEQEVQRLEIPNCSSIVFTRGIVQEE